MARDSAGAKIVFGIGIPLSNGPTLAARILKNHDGVCISDVRRVSSPRGIHTQRGNFDRALDFSPYFQREITLVPRTGILRIFHNPSRFFGASSRIVASE